mgnify:FL=1
MTDKLREIFDEMTVFKDLKNSNFFNSLSLPSFLRDWMLRKFEDDEGNFDIAEVSEFVNTYLPNPEEWTGIKSRIINDGERIQFLTRIIVDIDIKTADISFALPAFGLTTKETVIEPYVWNKVRSDLTASKETWGIVELGYRPPDSEIKQKGKITLTGFTNFCPYTVDLDYFKDVRGEFSTSEWIDVILGAIDYNADGYADLTEKLAVITRLLPFVEKRLNLIELAPKGTGKSYLFGQVSKYGWLSSGGTMSRAKMFYDMSKHMPGLVSGNDFVAIDEVQATEFPNPSEMRSSLQGYLENGQFTVGTYSGSASSGLILLGNIDKNLMDEYQFMFGNLPGLFRADGALLDRFHGFIKGWEIPRMHDDLKICGWALNSEYFCTIMHLLRDDISYRAIVDRIIDVPEQADTRDTEAVKRIATAYLKLLFPNVRTAEDVNLYEFKRYCLKPACRMRRIIRMQISMFDSSYKPDIPNFSVKDI